MKKIFWLALLSLCVVASTARAQVTVIKAGKLIDPEVGTASSNEVIVVEGGKITAVGAGLQTPAGADVIDLSAETA